jgi:hypothetical protein
MLQEQNRLRFRESLTDEQIEILENNQMSQRRKRKAFNESLQGTEINAEGKPGNA